MIDKPIPIGVRSENGKLVPIDPASQEAILKLRPFVIYHVVPEVPEGQREEHRQALGFYMAGIGLLADNLDDVGPGRKWPTKDHLRKHFLRALGYANPVYRRDGSYTTEPESMAMDAMPIEVLRELTEQSRAYAIETWGYDPWLSWSDEHKTEQHR